MKYPKINKKELNIINKKRFTDLYNLTLTQVQFDNKENDMKLIKGDTEILAWNIATIITVYLIKITNNK